MFDKSEASEARSEAQSGMMPDIFEADESMQLVPLSYLQIWTALSSTLIYGCLGTRKLLDMHMPF